MLHSPAMPGDSLVPLEEMVARLERLLAGSPADATDLVWIELRRGQESTDKKQRRETYEYTDRTLLLRVRESGRIGWHHTSVCELSDLENGLRQALAQARLSPPAPPPLPPDVSPLPEVSGLYDPELAGMTPARARELAQSLAGKGETARLGWAEGRVAVLSSLGRKRTAEATAGWLEAACGGTPGAGRAAVASRSLAGLDLAGTLDRARRRHGPADVVPPPDGPVPVVLSQEAAAALVDLLNKNVLTSDSFHDGTSFLKDGLNTQAFHRAVNLRDDATDSRGLPLPFDLSGVAKRPVDLIAEGIALTPAVDERLAQATGLLRTPHLVAPDEAIATNLFLLPGTGPDSELLRRADGGLWIGSLARLECFSPRTLRFRAVARGVRRITGGALGRSVPNLLWEDDLRALLSRVLGVGSELVPVATSWRLLGATTAPLLALDGAAEMRIAPEG